MRGFRIWSSLAAVAVFATGALAQSFNIDVTNFFGNPSNTYGGAVAQPGFWSNVDAFGGLGPQALNDISGAPTSVTLDSTSGFNFAFNNAATFGDDQALLDDAQDPSGTSVWTIAGLAAGNYKVIAYAWAPDSPLIYITGVNVTGGSNGTQNCGGAAWTGSHLSGITYVTDQVNGVPAGGSITITFTTVSGAATVNGLQLTKLQASGPTAYCTSGTSTNGCWPTISAVNNPSLSLAAPCQVTINGLEGQKTGLIFYSLTQNPTGALWCASGTSLLCVKAPTQRTNAQNSGGTTNACNGTITLNWDAFQASHPSALGQPWFVGSKAHLQGWYRDPPACKTTQLTQALTLTYLP